MFYRENKSSEESASSDEESLPLCKERRLEGNDDPMQGQRAGSKAAQMWADFLAEQSLSETLSGKVGVYQGEDDVVERGVESYILPETRNKEKAKYEKRERPPPADDSDPFDFIADEDQIEGGPQKTEHRSRRYDYRSNSRDGNSRRGSSASEGGGTKSGKHSASTSRHNSWEDERRGQSNHGRNRGYNHGIGSNGRKRRRGRRNRNSVTNPNYTLESLMAAEFPPNIKIGELARRIAWALGERDAKFMISVICELGQEKALELFEKTREIEAAGGMKVADGTRRRTPGGVFMTLFKIDPDVLPVLKAKICNIKKDASREIRRANRRKQKEVTATFGDALKEVQTLMKLPKASDALLAGRSEGNGNSADVPVDEV